MTRTGPTPAPAVVVVNHDSGGGLAAFLRSLSTEPVSEVIVVDNASSDGSAAGLETELPLTVVPTGVNLGYGTGANRGVDHTTAELVLVSNPDVAVHPGALEVLAAALIRDPTLAIVGPTILTPDGARYPSPRRFPSFALAGAHALLGTFLPGNRFSRRYRMDDLASVATTAATGAPSAVATSSASGSSPPVAVLPGSSVPVDWVSGACFLARRRALEELGGFDQSYFMYVEDLDLCWRAHRAGWGVGYVPEAVVTHRQGLSTSHRPYRMLLAHHRSALHFARRTTTGWRRLALPGVALVLAVRFLMALTRQVLHDRHKIGGPGG